MTTPTPETPEPRPRGRPRKPGGPVPTRSLRIGPEWDEAMAIAKAQGTSLNRIIEVFLRRYVARHAGEKPGRTT